jgi:hypothetical protein
MLEEPVQRHFAMSEHDISEPPKVDLRPPDPFKPAQPHIPGVATPAVHGQEYGGLENDGQSPGLLGEAVNRRLPDPANLKLLWVGITLSVALATGALLFTHAHATNPFIRNEPAIVQAKDVPADAPPPRRVAEEAPSPDGKERVAPGAVATTAEIAKPWSSKRFLFRDPVTSKAVPALLVRLPGGVLWAFSLREPYGSCELEYVTDLKQLQDQYGFTGTHPMVADPCNRTLFDLMQYGNGPSGYVRGEVAQGSGWRPPMAIELRTKGAEIIATRMEE